MAGLDPAILEIRGSSPRMTVGGLHHPLIGADQVERGFARYRAPAIGDGAAQRHVAPDPAAGGVVRRADRVRQIEKRVLHREAAVPYRLDPPSVDAGIKTRVRAQVLI